MFLNWTRKPVTGPPPESKVDGAQMTSSVPHCFFLISSNGLNGTPIKQGAKESYFTLFPTYLTVQLQRFWNHDKKKWHPVTRLLEILSTRRKQQAKFTSLFITGVYAILRYYFWQFICECYTPRPHVYRI